MVRMVSDRHSLLVSIWQKAARQRTEVELPEPVSSTERKRALAGTNFGLLQHSLKHVTFETEIIQSCYRRTEVKSFQNIFFLLTIAP